MLNIKVNMSECEIEREGRVAVILCELVVAAAGVIHNVSAQHPAVAEKIIAWATGTHPESFLGLLKKTLEAEPVMIDMTKMGEAGEEGDGDGN